MLHFDWHDREPKFVRDTEICLDWTSWDIRTFVVSANTPVLVSSRRLYTFTPVSVNTEPFLESVTEDWWQYRKSHLLVECGFRKRFLLSHRAWVFIVSGVNIYSYIHPIILAVFVAVFGCSKCVDFLSFFDHVVTPIVFYYVNNAYATR